jgi:anti-sigma factor RsiW
MMLLSPHESRWLSAYLEGVLPSQDAARVAGHLLGCRPCRRELELVREGLRLGAALAASPPSEESLPAWSDLAPLLAAPRPPRMTWSFRWATALAAVAVLAAGGALCWPRSAGPSPLEQAALAAHRTPTVTRTGDDASVRRWLVEGGLRAAWPASVAGRTLLGASPLPGGGAALSFDYQGEPVTLAMARAGEAGGGGKRIAYRTVGDLEVASWLSGDQSYVLVSRLRGDASCAVCHGARI